MHYASALPFGLAFFIINLPFQVLAWQRMGRRFTFKTFTAVALLSALSQLMPVVLTLQRVQPVFAALGDLIILLAATPWLTLQQAALSVMGAVVMGAVVMGAVVLNLTLAVNHRPEAVQGGLKHIEAPQGLDTRNMASGSSPCATHRCS